MLARLQKLIRLRSAEPQHALPDALWFHTISQLPFLQSWGVGELARLRDLSTQFLVEKNIFSGHESLLVTPEMRCLIAAQASTLILHRSLTDYAGWSNIIVHPDGFLPSGDVVDEAGVVHVAAEPIAGEAWPDGPVLLSWPDVWASREFEAVGMNLVIHEFAHKIDMRTGVADGVPQHDSHADHNSWVRNISAAYADFCQRVDNGEETEIDPYAAEHEAEFFAVCAEIYVVAPTILRRNYRDFYQEMNHFFKLWQDE